MKKHVYLLPGREETFADNLAKSIESLGLTLCGREIVRDFARLRFPEQLALIKSDLQTVFWKPDAKIVARSYGAPMVVGLGPEILAAPPGTPIVVDGDAGEVVVAPGRRRLRAAEAAMRRAARDRAGAGRRRPRPARTRDGRVVRLLCNAARAQRTHGSSSSSARVAKSAAVGGRKIRSPDSQSVLENG